MDFMAGSFGRGGFKGGSDGREGTRKTEVERGRRTARTQFMSVEPRLFVDAPLTDGALLDLDRDQAHYLVNVMRRKPGDGVRLFNGRDGEWRAEVASADRKRASLQIVQQRRSQCATPDMALFFAPVKKARTDFIVEKATELGVSAITPVITQRTQSDRVRTDRLQALAREAAEQTERLDIPQISDPVSLTRCSRTGSPIAP
jgi:16S rRNA (uracil1498-N3)-methyltransferase